MKEGGRDGGRRANVRQMVMKGCGINSVLHMSIPVCACIYNHV